jgi:hypothetical protein
MYLIPIGEFGIQLGLKIGGLYIAHSQKPITMKNCQNNINTFYFLILVFAQFQTVPIPIKN